MTNAMKHSTALIVVCAFLVCAGVTITGVAPGPSIAAQIDARHFRIEFTEDFRSRIAAKFGDHEVRLTDFSGAEYIIVNEEEEIRDFTFQSMKERKFKDEIGSGSEWTLTGTHDSLQKTVRIRQYDDYPAMAVYDVSYVNMGTGSLQVTQWVNNEYQVIPQSEEDAVPFWSFQGGSYRSRPDWVLPVRAGSVQENYLGMNASDYGGGVPVLDLWRPDVGIAVGHLEMKPKLVSLPVVMDSSKSAQIGVEFKVDSTLNAGQKLSTFTTFMNVHTGDYFASLRDYQRLMVSKGVEFKSIPESAYEPVWCAWGYGRDFTIDQITASLEKVKSVGYKWAVLDDGWQIAEGDWRPNQKHFPNADASMKEFVQTIHGRGLKAKLWWAPLAADPGSKIMQEHPEYLLRNQDGSLQRISWWNAYYLDPSHPGVQQYTKELVVKMLRDWGYDGLKIDGQHLNAAPPCHDPDHKHARPEDSVEAMPDFFRIIYETALEINPESVVEICPCGTTYSFFTLPYMNQSVASDPTSSWQIRLKGKTFKALMGPSAPYYGDHVELSDGGTDFASTIGVGGIIGTKFTVVPRSDRQARLQLSGDREKEWKRWLDLYEQHMLPTGTYLGDLYDIGFDKPEAHAVLKNGRLHYAFYAEEWTGPIQLRGLDASKRYRIHDYVNRKDLGRVEGPVGSLEVAFTGYLLVQAIPE